jgi:hypothetical protein
LFHNKLNLCKPDLAGAKMNNFKYLSHSCCSNLGLCCKQQHTQSAWITANGLSVKTGPRPKHPHPAHDHLPNTASPTNPGPDRKSYFHLNLHLCYCKMPPLCPNLFLHGAICQRSVLHQWANITTCTLPHTTCLTPSRSWCNPPATPGKHHLDNSTRRSTTY